MCTAFRSNFNNKESRKAEILILMSLFSIRLGIILEENGINQMELAKRTNLTPCSPQLPPPEL